MAATNDTPNNIPVPLWDSEIIPLKDFSSKRPVPALVKVVKGKYMSIGVSNFSLHKQHQDVYIHSVKMGVKVLAHSLRRVDATSRRGLPITKLVPMEQRLAIPIAYQGWFEVASEDGKSARPIASVLELARLFPQRCLVRENVRAYLANGEGKLTAFDKTKMIQAGEQLKLCGDLSFPAPSVNTKVKLLRCEDSKGDSVYLSYDQKGLFTPIAGAKDVTGVFSIKDIIKRFRLPLTVKLIQGIKPKVDPSRFSTLIRLDWVYTDETAFISPLEKNHVRILPVPTDTPIYLTAPSNHDEIKASDAFKMTLSRCNKMVANYHNTIHLLVNLPESVVRDKHRSSSNIFSSPQKLSESPQSSIKRSKSREDMLMDEIDTLYQYVRDGGPTPKLKLTYDSDEESYWEEPAYEPLDDFRARVRAIDAGQKVSHHAKYKPTDPKRINFDADPDVTASGNIYGVVTAAPGSSNSNSNNSDEPPPLPPRQSVVIENGTRASPPPLPPREYTRSKSEQQLQIRESMKSAKSGSKGVSPKGKEKFMGTSDSNSGSSGGHRQNLGRDFRDSDISSRTKGSSGGSHNAKQRMQFLYL
ncbi:hypothetical protein LOTGIDRAFT_228055 [Lottia gigantea]|uniref:CABIT domain-containing protein n=1 Tax=Lottia gigantea TaxID=225164 RepID=V4CSI0_LOTGI|nr:hypothetical protein LOTGIDRAFT_228055 [Lottia gigantea]ESP05490.1 hypothetical protein LOTGIDRAFT_228055 [Lottia gigantea]